MQASSQHHSLPLLYSAKNPGTPGKGDWVGSKVGLDELYVWESIAPVEILTPVPPAHSLVSTLSTLARLLTPCLLKITDVGLVGQHLFIILKVLGSHPTFLAWDRVIAFWSQSQLAASCHTAFYFPSNLHRPLHGSHLFHTAHWREERS